MLDKSISLVVFDLDGTLVDSHRDLADSANAMLVEFGAAPLAADEITAMVGDGAAMLVRRVLKRGGLAAADARFSLERFLVHYDERLLATTKPYDGMVETLDALRAGGRRLAVLTNKPHRATLRILEGLGLLQLFSDVIGGDTTYGRKPDPAGLLAIVSNANVSPEKTVLVGDSAVDLATARAAGTAICLARYGFGFRFKEREFNGAEMFIDTPGQLLSSMHPGNDLFGRVNGGR